MNNEALQLWFASGGLHIYMDTPAVRNMSAYFIVKNL